MNEISNIGMTGSYAPHSAPAWPAESTRRLDADPTLMQSDPVEFSRLGRLLAGAEDTSSLRLARIRAIRAEIEDGSFETPQRISGTVDRIIRELRSR